MNLFTIYYREIIYRVYYIFVSFFSLTLALCFEVHPLLFHLAKPIHPYKLVLTDLPEFWITSIYVCFYLAVFLTFFVLVYNLWAFIVSALFYKERKRINSFFFFNCLMYLGFFYITLSVIIPQIVHLLFLSQTNSFFMPIQYLPKLYPYVQVVLNSLLYCLMISLIPGIMMISLSTRLISWHIMMTERKVVLLLGLLISATISPPDITSQISLSFIFFSFYELMLFYAIWFYEMDFELQQIKKPPQLPKLVSFRSGSIFPQYVDQRYI